MFGTNKNPFTFSNGGKTVTLFGDSASIGDRYVYDGGVSETAENLCRSVGQELERAVMKHGTIVLAGENFALHVGSMTACGMWAGEMFTAEMITNMTGNRMENVQINLPTGVAGVTVVFRDNDNDFDGVGCFIGETMLY